MTIEKTVRSTLSIATLAFFFTIECYNFVTVLGNPNSRIVHTKYGPVRGFIHIFPKKQLRSVEVFLGIPFASAPVGSLRFMPPVTPAPWRGIWRADQFGPVCPQKYPEIQNTTTALKSMTPGRLAYFQRILPLLQNQSEDCLFLNVYSPRRHRNTSRVPVIVVIHGDSYEWYSGNIYDGSVLASAADVIVITLNFRLGVLGFLPSLTGAARGNYGLMDQVAALHWIRENIAEFGGTIDNITLLGHGHGAALVNLLMLSPMAKGLFSRVILQSGSALSPWAMASESPTYTRHLALILGCPVDNHVLMVACMRQRPLSDIMRVQLLVPKHLTGFGPTVDGIVIPNEPEMLLRNYSYLHSQYELLIGVTRNEFYHHFSTIDEKYGIEPDRRDKLLRTLVRNVYTHHLQEIFLTIVNEYTDWTKTVQHPVNILRNTASALGDALIVAPAIRVANYHSKVNDRTFLYVFGHHTEHGNYPGKFGCVHGEELPYVFGAPLVDGNLSYFQYNFSHAEQTLSMAVMTYWTNFAKNPNFPFHRRDLAEGKLINRFDRIEWPLYDALQQKYLIIGMKPKVRDHYHAHRMSLWLHLIPKLDRNDIGVPAYHHLLDDHDNANLYDGIVRHVVIPTSFSLTTTTIPIPPRFPIPTLSEVWNISESTEPTANDVFTTMTPDEILNYAFSTSISDTTAVVLQNTNYSTALSVTIAVGCSLLVLNVLVFAGVFYQRDRYKIEGKLQRRNYKVKTPNQHLEIPQRQKETTRETPTVPGTPKNGHSPTVPGTPKNGHSPTKFSIQVHHKERPTPEVHFLMHRDGRMVSTPPRPKKQEKKL
ncbi:neuroligin-4, X-linked-like isoform X2 [Limulus polyphemus]|uniref:Neuroligin-4, X-linked-like isoform X2 n=1 Tax=Limulus polyphemus TaxID=6850 RepID=A0ABM1T4E3_LIMPO|nr:neuroligin-4, X-linked-like isoform X2 [Limulus polyphemus]